MVSSSATSTVRPSEESSLAEPLASGVPEQSAVEKTLTVEPASAEPLTSGWLSLAGEFGSVSVSCGASGPAVSTVNELLAGVGSMLPAWSRARTSKMWGPSPSAGAAVCELPGPEQAPNEAESKRHSKPVAPPVAEKSKVGVASLVRPLGPESTWVWGALESSV